ncbi:hypothetical protein GQ55_5G211200 [Panicum hallii var. hallii]|uniref:Receptor-like serine/threonine-protein kinase n=1 Tax=Panicum hallii var. hallii TaxID=1504633 RepID=A0A2T7DIM2_9POAL|nr:hypothetical protein GQ55_5G211200 [Panicum hallii var. hallii]
MATHLANNLRVFEVSMPKQQCKMLGKSTCLAFLMICLHPLLLCSAASGPSQLGAGSALSVEDHARPFLVSPDATFSCGFLEAGENAFYFSVWYTGAADKTAVWTANPGAPVNGRGSRITFRRDGGLALTDANGTAVWESKTSGEGLTVSLLDSGNLVISDPSGTAVWQSFDWPTDTLVPSQPLTKETTLVSGYFSLYYDNDNVLRLRYDGPDTSSIYWPSPDYNVFGNGRTSYNSSRIGVLDDDGVFLSSDNLAARASDLGPGVKRRLTIEQDGNVRIHSLNATTGGWTVTWAAMAQPCSVHGACGQNAICEYQPGLRCSCLPGYEMVDRKDWRRGCRPMFSVTNCSQGQAPPEGRFKFVKVAQTDFYGYDLGYNSSVTFEHCKKLCLEMCSCSAFSYRLTGTGVCYPKGTLFNGYTSPNFPGSIYIKLPIDFDASAQPVAAHSSQGLACNPDGPEIIQGSPDTFRRPRNNAKWSYLFAFATVLGVVDVIFIATSWWFLSSKQSIPSSLEAGYRMVTGQFRRFTYRELKDATGNFKEEIGRGGSGVVYRGVLDGGKVVAVKKLTNVAGGDEEFWAEMTVIGRINHMNLVRIWGFCSQGKHKLLVYEYVENESLDRHLFDMDRTALPWRERYRIALGTARGLAYLHHECLEWVIHCDVKPENILLTREFDAKIADFGLAKLSKRDGAGDSFQLSHMRGTTGYMAPEWARNVPVDAKVDVYSYGIVLLEIVIGSRISDQTTAGGERLEMSQIAQALRQVVDTGDVVPLVDGRLQGQFNPRQALEMVRISLSCMQERSNDRPTMDDIAKVLTACDDEDEHPAYRS